MFSPSPGIVPSMSVNSTVYLESSLEVAALEAKGGKGRQSNAVENDPTRVCKHVVKNYRQHHTWTMLVSKETVIDLECSCVLHSY